MTRPPESYAITIRPLSPGLYVGWFGEIVARSGDHSAAYVIDGAATRQDAIASLLHWLAFWELSFREDES